MYSQECCGCCLLGRFAKWSSSTSSTTSCVPPFYLTDLCRQSFIQCCTSVPHDVTVTTLQPREQQQGHDHNNSSSSSSSSSNHHHQTERQFESTVSEVEIATTTTPKTCKYKIYMHKLPVVPVLVDRPMCGMAA